MALSLQSGNGISFVHVRNELVHISRFQAKSWSEQHLSHIITTLVKWLEYPLLSLPAYGATQGS